jgi:hypothetical protein
MRPHIDNDFQFQEEGMKNFVSALTIITVLAAASGAQAAQRTFVWTEEYGTLAKGNAEVEYWSTAVTRDTRERNASDWNQKLEIEYGVTDRFNVALYQVFEQAADSNTLTYVGYNVELKYRIAEANVLPIDVLLYAEREVSTVEGNVTEGKVILAKEIGNLSLAYNQIYEYVSKTGTGEYSYAAGVGYSVVPWLKIGLESKGSFKYGEYAAGPTLSWMGNRIWADIGAVFALNHNTNDREVRFLMGIPF